MVAVRCNICGVSTDYACWAKTGMNESRGWLCINCYNSLWNVLDRNEY